MHLTGSTALVTGASRGIGRAIAIRLAEHGARVAVHYRGEQNAAEETLGLLKGNGHCALQADLRDPDACQRLVTETVRTLGAINILVNNAGVFDSHPIRSLTFEQWQEAWNTTIGTNLFGAAHVSFCAVQHMLRSGGGRIVNVSSRGAFRGEPDAPAYGASKAGMNAFGQSLAKALAPEGIYVFTVAPGFVETERVLAKLTPAMEADIRAQSPFGRMATPDDVARTVLYLASEAPEFLTGCIVDINGASYLRT
jgi:NAD(P)-dependent dehydrogenase (short-subunit alcohol dehydrogenase family)